MLRALAVAVGLAAGLASCADGQSRRVRAPVIDVHLHAMPAEGFGRPPVWPEAVGLAIDAIESAPLLTAAQKRDILFSNAVRFFRLDPSKRLP